MSQYWNMDNESGDEGSALAVATLVAVNAPTSGAGVVGSARVFNGSNQVFTIASGNAAQFNPTGSFSCRVRFNGAGTFPSRTLVSKYHTTGNQRAYDLEFGSGPVMRLIVSSGGADTTSFTYSGFTPVSGTWYDVFFGYDAIGQRLWMSVDAAAPQFLSYAHGINPDSTADFCIGGINSGTSQRWHGSIDTIAWFDGTWTYTDIKRLHETRDWFPGEIVES